MAARACRSSGGTAGDIVVEGSTGHLQYGLVDVRVGRGGGPLKPSPRCWSAMVPSVDVLTWTC